MVLANQVLQNILLNINDEQNQKQLQLNHSCPNKNEGFEATGFINLMTMYGANIHITFFFKKKVLPVFL